MKNIDIIGRELKVDDFVVYYNNIYKVTKVHDDYASIILAKPSKNTRNKVQYCKDLTLLPTNDVLIWLLKK